jgi:hypothetical protein
MDSVSLASSLVSAQIGRIRLEVAAKLLRAQADPVASDTSTVEAAQQNINGLAILAASLGSKVDVSV